MQFAPLNGGGVMWAVANWLKRQLKPQVQRGIATAAGTITISPVDMATSYVICFSKGSAGEVAARGTVGASGIAGGRVFGMLRAIGLTISGGGGWGDVQTPDPGDPTGIGITTAATGATLNPIGILTGQSTAGSVMGVGLRAAMTGTVNAAAITGGTTNLTTRQFSARLTSPTTLQVDGACEWQVIS